MTTEDFIIKLFCRVDEQMLDASKHSQAKLYPSEVVTLALLFALKGVGAFRLNGCQKIRIFIISASKEGAERLEYFFRYYCFPSLPDHFDHHQQFP